jgi:hypothetical protein
MLLDLNYNMKQLMKPNYFLEFAGSRLSERPPWEELEARGDRGVDSCCSRHCSMVEYHGVSLHIVTKTSIPSPFEYPAKRTFRNIANQPKTTRIRHPRSPCFLQNVYGGL